MSDTVDTTWQNVAQVYAVYRGKPNQATSIDIITKIHRSF